VFKNSRPARPLLFTVLFIATGSPIHAWGCKGHETVALIAEAHLSPNARAMALKILAESPIDPSLSRYCKEPNLDAFTDASTWADDERQVQPATAPWHFINIPRGAPETSMSQFCPPATGCITSALAAQLAILRDRNATAQARADALRFVIHFVGDIHQPLHDTNNNDQGGNCVPVTFFGEAPMERNPITESYRPNLHGVWDASIIDQLSGDATPQQLAIKLNEKFHPRIESWQSETPDFTKWAWEGHELAEKITYGQLPVKIAVEPPLPELANCAADNHVSSRLLALHEDLEAPYQSAAAPAVEEQLTKAGIRLAALLNSLWP
jgi:S1/P1 Nuclease